MGFGDNSCVADNKQFADDSQNTQRNTGRPVWSKPLFEQKSVDNNGCYSSLSPTSLLRDEYGLDDNQDGHKQTNIQPTTSELLDQLRQLDVLVKKFKYKQLSHRTTCEAKDGSGSAPSMRVITSDISHNEYRFPMTLFVVNKSRNINSNLNSILIDQKEHKLIYQDQEFQLGSFRENIIDLHLSCVKYVSFSNCHKITSLDVSDTFIVHMDIRYLVGLQHLRLTNTNVRRLNLVNQRRLTVLHCNYTLVDCLRFTQQSSVLELRIECSRQIKSNELGAGSSVSIDQSQTVDNYQCKEEIRERIESHVISYPQARDYEKETRIIFPQKCNALIDRNIKRCRKLRFSQGTIDSFEIGGYACLEELVVKNIECSCFHVYDLPLLTSVKITESVMQSISFPGFPNLRAIEVTWCLKLELLNIEKCGKLEELNASYTRITQLDTRRLRWLRKLDVSGTNIARLDVSHNVLLEELSIGDTEVSQLNTNRLPKLRRLDASRTAIRRLNVSRNTALEEISVNNDKIPRLDISSLAALRKLDASYTIISQIDVCDNPCLEELDVSGTKLSRLDVIQLARLRKLLIHLTKIEKVDLSSNKQLVTVHASSNCEVENCCCSVRIQDWPLLQ